MIHFLRGHWLTWTATSRHCSPRWFCFHAWHLMCCRLNHIFIAFLQIRKLVQAELKPKLQVCDVCFALIREFSSGKVIRHFQLLPFQLDESAL